MLNLYSPNGIEKIIFSLSARSTSTCQYPLAKSRVENQQAQDRASRVLSIRGMGWTSFLVKLFIFLIVTHAAFMRHLSSWHEQSVLPMVHSQDHLLPDSSSFPASFLLLPEDEWVIYELHALQVVHLLYQSCVIPDLSCQGHCHQHVLHSKSLE